MQEGFHFGARERFFAVRNFDDFRALRARSPGRGRRQRVCPLNLHYAHTAVAIPSRPAAPLRGVRRILRLRPCRRPPWMQGAAGWLAIETGVFLYLRLSIWRPSGCILGTWGTIFVIMGSRGAPNGHTEGQMSICIDFWLHFGSLLGHTLGTIG